MLIVGFSCVNTRIVFDTKILLHNNKHEKVILDLYIDGKKQTKRISSKILKMDENNHYGQALAKALPYSCIKKQEHPSSLTEFNRILDKISHEDNTGHLFTVNTNFILILKLYYLMKYTPKYLKKKKNTKMNPYERSTLQLL